MREAVRDWRGVKGLENERICCGRMKGLACVVASWESRMEQRAEDGRRSTRWFGFMFA